MATTSGVEASSLPSRCRNARPWEWSTSPAGARVRRPNRGRPACRPGGARCGTSPRRGRRTGTARRAWSARRRRRWRRRAGRPGRRPPARRGWPRAQQEDTAQRAGGEHDAQRARGRGQGAPVDAVGQRAVPVQEVAGHAVGADLVAVPRVGRPPAHHGPDVAVADVEVVGLVRDACGQHGPGAGRQEQGQHQRVQRGDDSARGGHPDQGGHEPLGVLDRQPGAGHADLAASCRSANPSSPYAEDSTRASGFLPCIPPKAIAAGGGGGGVPSFAVEA